eukprot:766697-Hanusia_phi.AAC.10
MAREKVKKKHAMMMMMMIEITMMVMEMIEMDVEKTIMITTYYQADFVSLPPGSSGKAQSRDTVAQHVHPSR